MSTSATTSTAVNADAAAAAVVAVAVIASCAVVVSAAATSSLAFVTAACNHELSITMMIKVIMPFQLVIAANCHQPFFICHV